MFSTESVRSGIEALSVFKLPAIMTVWWDRLLTLIIWQILW